MPEAQVVQTRSEVIVGGIVCTSPARQVVHELHCVAVLVVAVKPAAQLLQARSVLEVANVVTYCPGAHVLSVRQLSAPPLG